MRILHLPTTASTNADAKVAAESGEPEGLVVHALRQTAGRGRQGRGWESPEGNLYMSLLLRPHCPPQEAGRYSFAAALAIYDAVQGGLPDAPVQLKWPNDVLVGGKKISGLLLEAGAAEGGVIPWLVIGIGINVRHHPEQALYPTTSLAAEGAAADVEDVLQALLAWLDHWLKVLRAEGFSPLRQAWLARARTGVITARLPNAIFEGTFAGLDDQGRLCLQLSDGSLRHIAAGDVFFGA